MSKFDEAGLKEFLQEIAVRDYESYGGYDEEGNMLDEDFNPQDYSGCNFDDAYEMGLSHGNNDAEIDLAIAILAKFFGEQQ